MDLRREEEEQARGGAKGWPAAEDSRQLRPAQPRGWREGEGGIVSVTRHWLGLTLGCFHKDPQRCFISFQTGNSFHKSRVQKKTHIPGGGPPSKEVAGLEQPPPPTPRSRLTGCVPRGQDVLGFQARRESFCSADVPSSKNLLTQSRELIKAALCRLQRNLEVLQCSGSLHFQGGAQACQGPTVPLKCPSGEEWRVPLGESAHQPLADTACSQSSHSARRSLYRG